MVLCCLDQSTKLTGYSIWKNGKLKKHGVIDVSRNNNLESRMIEMYQAIKALIKSAKPDVVVLEETQFQANKKTFRILAQMQGLVFAAATENSCCFITVEPTMWKSFVGVKGRDRLTQKMETIGIINKEHGLTNITDDEADAIAIGMWGVSNIEFGED